MKTLKNITDWIFRHDKLKHFFVGFFLFVLLHAFMPDWFALMITAIIALCKEILWDDMMEKGKAEFWDVAYGVVPGLLICLL